MLSLPGKPTRCCEGLSRREWLRVGGLGTLGLSLPGLLYGRSLAEATGSARPAIAQVLHPELRPPGSFGRAKSCIVLFMFGAPAHQDIWDLKPDAPAEIRGEFKPIASQAPGTWVGEHIPRLAQLSDRYALIRSLTHPDNTHTVAMHYMLTGVRHRRPATNPQNAPDDFPCFGAVANYVRARGWRPRPSADERTPATSVAMPTAVSLNAPANQVSANNHIFPGFFAGFLGSAFDPLFIPQDVNATDFQPLPPLREAPRLAGRRQLLAEVERQAHHLQQRAAVQTMDDYYQKALHLLTSPAARRAFDLTQEPPSVRQRYGNTPFGQGCLLARRLVEGGVSLVTVNWQRDDAFWDTHANNFTDLKNKLLPNMDQGFSALLEDLQQRGLFEETLIVWLGEFGRTPKINSNAGRDHWAACNSVLLAGAGIPGGQVYGASDRHAAYPSRDAVTPEDLSATIFHLLGIDAQHTIFGPDGRPLPLSTGQPVDTILG